MTGSWWSRRRGSGRRSEVPFALGAQLPDPDEPAAADMPAAPDQAAAPTRGAPRVASVTPRPALRPDDAVHIGLRVTAGYAWRLVVVAIAVYGIFLALGRVQLVAVALFVGLIFSALLRPIADRLHRWMPRGLAVAFAILAGLAVVVGVFAFITTSAVSQWASLQSQFSTGLTKIEDGLQGGPFGLSQGDVAKYVDEVRTWISSHQGQLAGQALGQATLVVEALTGLALALFCSIFFIHSGDRMWQWFIAQLPKDSQRTWDEAGHAGWTTFAGYTRGIVIVSGVNAVIVCLGLLVLRVPLAFPLALLVFFASFIPLVGAPIALAVATVVALAARSPLIAVAVVALIVLVGQFEGHVLQPLVMSRAVAIHPVAVALSVALGTVLAGIVGAVVAVPLVSVAWSVRRRLRGMEPSAPA